MPFCLKMSENINQTSRHLIFRYISIFNKSFNKFLTNLLRTGNERKTVKTITIKTYKKDKR